MKILKLTSIFLLLSIVSCYSDKGNYNYNDKEELTFENILDSYNVIGGVEPVVITPKITSSIGGIVSADNPNYEYEYWINLYDRENSVPWSLFTEGSQSVNMLTEVPTGSYKLWMKVLDKNTGVTHSKFSKLVISSVTYEGWLIFGTEGANKRSRLDMISYISADRQIPAYNIMESRGLPTETTGAYGIGFWPNFTTNTMDRIYLLTDQAAYLLEKNEFVTSEKSTINYVDFISPKAQVVPVVYRHQDARMLVDNQGDAYVQYAEAVGAKFAYPINTTIRGSKPEFKVAPFIGNNRLRPNFTSELFLLYDSTNGRFVGWDPEVQAGTVLFPLLNPGTDQKFDYKIGMDMIWMDGTSFDGGVVYAVLKDKSGNMNVAGIKVNPKNFEQHSYYHNIDAPKIKEATKFAFHSQFPLMFYAVGSEVYCYNLGTGTSKLALTLAGEEVTLIKFNLYGNTLTTYGELNKTDDEFNSIQYKLIVASYNNTDRENGGKFGLYNVNPGESSLTKNFEYKGFCRISDIVYRERRAMFN